MACVLKLFVVLLAFITVGQRRNGYVECSDSTSNGFLKFWRNNSNVLRFRTTDRISVSPNSCTWYRRQNCDDTGVNVSRWRYLISLKRRNDFGELTYWRFGENSSMWRVEEDGMEEQYLLYQEDNSSCAVIRSQYYMFAGDELKKGLVQECEERPESPRCKMGLACDPHPTDHRRYICRDVDRSEAAPPCTANCPDGSTYICRGKFPDHPNYHLFLSENSHEVPENCAEFYEDNLHNRTETKHEGIEECKPNDITN